MTAIELTMADVSRDAYAVWEWLRAHDLDPDRTRPGVRVENGRVIASLYVRDRDGRLVIERDPYTDTPLGPKTVDVNVPQLAPIPHGIGTVI